MTLELVKVSENVSIILTEDDDVFRVGGKSFVFKHTTSGAILREIARKHPGYLDNAEVGAILSQKGRDQYGVQRAILNLRTCLKRANVTDLVHNTRSQGYCLGQGWARSASVNDPEIQEALAEISTLCDAAVITVEKARIHDAPADLQWAIVDPSLAYQHFTRFYAARWKLIQALAVLPNADAAILLDLKGELDELLTYVTFMRIGNRYLEAAWREDFRKEISVLRDNVLNMAARALAKSQA